MQKGLRLNLPTKKNSPGIAMLDFEMFRTATHYDRLSVIIKKTRISRGYPVFISPLSLHGAAESVALRTENMASLYRHFCTGKFHMRVLI